VRKCCRY